MYLALPLSYSFPENMVHLIAKVIQAEARQPSTRDGN